MAGSWWVVAVALSATRPALPTHLPAPGPAEESGEDDSGDDDEGDEVVQRTRPRSHLNLIVQNLVRQNAFIRAENIAPASAT